MDELSCTNRLARRLALAAAICCAATSGYAGKPVSESGQTQSLGALLSQGWSDDKPAGDNVAKPIPIRALEKLAPTTSHPAAANKDAAAAASSVIVRPKLKVLEAAHPKLLESRAPKLSESPARQAEKSVLGTPESVPPATEPSTVATPVERIAPRKTSSLAELIKRRTKPIIVPPSKSISETTDVVAAPSVKRLDVEKQIAANMAKLKALTESKTNIRAANPIQAEPIPAPAKLAEAEPMPAINEATPLKTIDPPPRPQAKPAAKTAVDAIAASKIKSIPAASEVATTKTAAPSTAAPKTAALKPTAQKKAAPKTAAAKIAAAKTTESKIAESKSVETSTTESKPTFSELVESSAIANSAAAGADESVARDLGSSEFSDRSRRTAALGGFSLLPLEEIDPDAAARLELERHEPTLTETIHARRLREIAQDCLRNSRHRLQRRATHSAKKYAMEALRSIVAMQDVQSGGNQHARQLEVAFDAIRESADFCGRFGVIDESAMKRMVTVHETQALKQEDITQISSLEATETYLAVARKNLVLAAGDAKEASDALILLGRIEKQMSPPDDTHASSVAVTLQRAAVEIEPYSAFGYRELGTTLLSQGLTEQAVWALNRSIDIQPTRASYRQLLDASRRLGDIDTAQVCLASLQDPELENELPIVSLSPQAFAATHRPNLARIGAAKTKPESDNSPARKKTEVPKISLRSLIPFGSR